MQEFNMWRNYKIMINLMITKTNLLRKFVIYKGSNKIRIILIKI